MGIPHIRTTGVACHMQGSQQQEVQYFRTQFLENFGTISGHFCRFHEAQDTGKAHFYVLINVIH